MFNMQKRLQDKKKKVLLGAHLSIAGGLHHALYEASKLNTTAIQIFTKNAMTWKEKTLSKGLLMENEILQA